MSTATQTQEREWWVFSTAIQEVVLILMCNKTGATGIVRDPSADEWREAFYAPGRPYQWHDHSRVEVLNER